MICDALYLAQSSASGLSNHTGWVVAGVIVLLGLVIYGGGDLFRLSPLRIRAIASVCFRESIRRRVLWLIPLAILGVVLVAQFQRPLDEQDAVRQVTKFCIFTSALLVTLAAVIVACTNLPREIDNRVIYTVVTKPTSRLEILLGKILGFSGITAIILVIMGVFSWGYLQAFEWRTLQGVKIALSQAQLDPAAQETLKFYDKVGLLDARDYADSGSVEVLHSDSKPGDSIQKIVGGGEQDAHLPFAIPADKLTGDTKLSGAVVTVSLPWQQKPMTNEQIQQTAQMAEQLGIHSPLPAEPAGPGTEKQVDVSKLFPAFFRISFLSPQDLVFVDGAAISNDQPLAAPDASGAAAIQIPLSGPVADRLVAIGRFSLRITGLSPATVYTIDPSKVAITFVTEKGERIAVASAPYGPKAPAIRVTGRTNQNGQQLRGAAEDAGTVGVFEFSGVPAGFARGSEAVFEFRTTVERGGDEVAKQQQPSWLDIRVRNRGSGEISPPTRIAVETRRLAHLTVPSAFIKGGNFDVLVKASTPEHWISLRPGYMRLASDDRGFGLNLAKSMFILWLFTILAIIIAIFCSTFVSWPIAFVLTLLILLGHWGVLQLGSLAAPGVGRQVVSDLFSGAAPAVAETLNRSVEGLTSLLRLVSSFLPDISKFAAMEDIEKGVSLSFSRVADALKVLAIFGLSILTLSYVIFRNKEVAP